MVIKAIIDFFYDFCFVVIRGSPLFVKKRIYNLYSAIFCDGDRERTMSENLCLDESSHFRRF